MKSKQSFKFPHELSQTPETKIPKYTVKYSAKKKKALTSVATQTSAPTDGQVLGEMPARVYSISTYSPLVEKMPTFDSIKNILNSPTPALPPASLPALPSPVGSVPVGSVPDGSVALPSPVGSVPPLEDAAPLPPMIKWDESTIEEKPKKPKKPRKPKTWNTPWGELPSWTPVTDLPQLPGWWQTLQG